MHNWFKDEELYSRFYDDLNRCDRILRKPENLLLMNDFKQIVAGLHRVNSYFGYLKSSLINFIAHVQKLDDSAYKKKLIAVAVRVEGVLNLFSDNYDKAVECLEDIFKKRVITMCSEDIDFLRTFFYNLISSLDGLAVHIDSLAAIKPNKDVVSFKDKIIEPHTKIKISGKLRNGWKLADIQSVIVKIGGRVEGSTGGRHNYKIVFPNKTIPLWTNTPYDDLVKQVHEATGVNKQKLRAAFACGKI